MKGYSSANGDNRGILERFLPSTYRTTKDGSNAHNAFLGAIKGSIETTRDDMENMSLQVYFTRATGKFLDLYGKYIGISRNDYEEDQSYRDRIVKYITTKRGTIEAIIDGIKNEIGDPDLPVSIYETWRNIFIMNKSTLNGLDYIMGEKYRYAVIEITVGKYIEPSILTDIVERYKSYGVKVLYRYALGMSDEEWNDIVDFSQEFIDNDNSYSLANYMDPYYKRADVLLGDSPITIKDINLFKMNSSKLNSSDVISGNPENAYIYDYSKSPFYHIIGFVPNSDSIENHTDMFGYIYDNNIVPIPDSGDGNLYRFGTEPYLVTSRKDSSSYNFSPESGSSTVLGINVSRYFINNGYEELISNYNKGSINSINIYTKGSEIGLPMTYLTAVGSDGKNISGKFDSNNSNSISDKSKSSESYRYLFNNESSVSNVNIEDYYNYGYSNRLVTIKTPNIELPLGIFKGQSTGNISVPNYDYPDKNFISLSTNRFRLNIESNSKNVMIYNYTSKKWENYDYSKYYEIGDYIQDAKSIQGAYMLVKFTDSEFEMSYFNLEFDTVTIPYTGTSSESSSNLGQFILDQSKLG